MGYSWSVRPFRGDASSAIQPSSIQSSSIQASSTRMMQRLALAAGSVLAMLTVLSTVTPAAAEPLCKAPRDLIRLGVPLAAAQRIMVQENDIRIVALGSSSTEGAGASSPKMCYPAQLEAELNRRFYPDRRFEVLNLGVGGERASNMLARLDTEVLALKPHLVIWQTGVNDAIAGVDIDDFRMMLAQGIDAILASGADVILLDSQYYPKSAQVPGFSDYLTTMRQVAREKGIALLSRFSIMKHLVDSRQFTPAQLLAPDLFHSNDLSYSCLGNLLADAIGDGLERAAGITPSQRTRSATLR